MSKTSKILSVFRFLTISLTVSLVLLPIWLYQNFGITVLSDNMLFHVLMGTDALIGVDHQIIRLLINELVLLPLGIALIFEFTLLILKFKLSETKKRKYQNFYNYIGLLDKKSILFGIVLIAAIDSSCSLGATQYFYQQTASKDYFSAYYTKPGLVLKRSVKKKNLIILYVESLEQNLTNREIFGTNIIEPIDKLPGITIKKFAAAPGTGCTIAGIVSSQCAIPLRAAPFIKDLKLINFFLPKATCIGDILASQGYDQYLFIGSDLRFTRVDKFYQNHGYKHLYGKREFASSGTSPSLFRGWGNGLNDDTLLDEAFNHIIKAAKSNKPFNAVIMTTDSHPPKGTPSPRCSQPERDNGLIGTYQCTSRFVAAFIEKLQNRGILDNTTLILMGDHPLISPPEYFKYFPNPRYVYFKIFDPNFKKKPTRDTMTHFDVAPTILDLLNIQLSTHKQFGLGVSIFANSSQVDYKKLFDAVTKQSILNPSKTYDSLWRPTNH
ncbi:phosphoglycerol transferase [Gammaproteobacteria bacterium]